MRRPCGADAWTYQINRCSDRYLLVVLNKRLYSMGYYHSSKLPVKYKVPVDCLRFRFIKLISITGNILTIICVFLIMSLQVYACQHCQVAKNTVLVGPQQHLLTVGNSWSVVTVDLMGPFHTSDRSHAYAVIMTDLFTKWIMILPLCDVSASEISKAIINIFFLYGPPQKIIMDQRDEFIEQVGQSANIWEQVSLSVSDTQFFVLYRVFNIFK